ncbi:MAG: hypothetical protein DMF80_15860 [Acidobacteria bacterium]|nr:MAG: hypothetical protein DMF80_15860 [Acidobacteriota bacterium]PYQ18947.1 MAG: hypothetical protein DMF81_23435 [Acidobacteriota bacterium]
MDDNRIRELTEEVLSQIREGGTPATADLESRVSALEEAVARLQAGRLRTAAPAAVHVHTHPSLQLLSVPGGSDRCIMEPDKPCVSSGSCRTLGH